MDAWVDRYEKSHQNPINRVFHTFGIPMIAISIPLFLIAQLVRGFWKTPLSLFYGRFGFAKCLNPSPKVSQPNSSKTGGSCWSDRLLL
jgi:hypothetical protein